MVKCGSKASASTELKSQKHDKTSTTSCFLLKCSPKTNKTSINFIIFFFAAEYFTPNCRKKLWQTTVLLAFNNFSIYFGQHKKMHVFQSFSFAEFCRISQATFWFCTWKWKLLWTIKFTCLLVPFSYRQIILLLLTIKLWGTTSVLSA